MKSENDMSDEELEQYEQETQVVHDKWDSLEDLRLLLNNSRCQQMYVIKRSSSLGPQCPYFKKAKRLFIQDEQTAVLNKLKTLVQQFEEEIKHVK